MKIKNGMKNKIYYVILTVLLIAIFFNGCNKSFPREYNDHLLKSRMKANEMLESAIERNDSNKIKFYYNEIVHLDSIINKYAR
jgi:PBP1b-binding outer membrane lipoprotein LpoB